VSSEGIWDEIPGLQAPLPPFVSFVSCLRLNVYGLGFSVQGFALPPST